VAPVKEKGGRKFYSQNGRKESWGNSKPVTSTGRREGGGLRIPSNSGLNPRKGMRLKKETWSMKGTL